jgi:hypothetical protein
VLPDRFQHDVAAGAIDPVERGEVGAPALVVGEVSLGREHRERGAAEVGSFLRQHEPLHDRLLGQRPADAHPGEKTFDTVPR